MPNPSKEKHGGTAASTGHKRSISGTLLSKLSFSQPNQDGEGEAVAPHIPSQPAPRSPRPVGGGAMATAMKQSKSRKRKGSLRKTALLGTGRLKTEQIPKMESKGDESPDSGSSSEPASPVSPEDPPTPTPFPKAQPPVPWVSHPVHGILHKALIEHTPAGKLQKSPTLSSATDEDDLVKSGSALTANKIPPLTKPLFSSGSSTSDSYFPPQPGILPRRSRHSPKSPLSTVAVEALPSTEEWDYSETRWWGWVVLAVTWIVFVVGMGSCFEVWSWAWDVGETPYAPPELEDDPTLPIVGYYPALIILTAVMAWVWVTVAWVGMKYFRHAKMGGEDEG